MLESSQKLTRLQALMKALRSYLPQDKYNRLAKKIAYWETESIWQKLESEVNALQIPKDPSNEKCVRIYAALHNKDFKTMKAQMLDSKF